MTVGKRQWNLPLMLMVTTLFALGNEVLANTVSTGLHTDIEYGQAEGVSLRLDAFVPEEEKLHPVVVMVHGGGWVGGNKQDMHFLCEPLIKTGFTCFSVGYRLAPAYRWPACLDDVQTAIDWVKAHAADYKGDPNRIALVGYSAGGHLACMAAVKEPVQAVVGIAPPTDHLSDSKRRGGLSECMQKLLDRPKEIDEQSKTLLERISPINHVTSQLPPYLLIHGTADQSVPYEQSINFMAKLKEHNVPCDLITIEEAPHRISEWDKYGVDYRQQMAGWLWQTIGLNPQQVSSSEANARIITVSADGTGDFTTVQAAVDAIEEQNAAPIVIAIKPGTYKEKIIVPRSKRFVTFRGQNAKQTVLTYDQYASMKNEQGQELGTFRTPSVTIEADDFTAENITFENTAGDVGQAVAVTVVGDRIVFRNCRFLGWQDTLLDQTGRHYYKDCTIVGHCDFIFGGGTAFFDKCRIHCLKNGYITAASTPEYQAYGYVFSNCKITGAPDVKTYLGRPWRDYASVVFLNTKMSNVVRPEGWHNWDKPNREKTAFYAEYNSTGPGADPATRVDWSHQLAAEEAEKFTLEKVLSADDGWDPISGTVRSSLKIAPASVSDAEKVKKKAIDETADNSAYLFACFRGKDEDGLYLTYSENGLDWIELGGPFLTSAVNSHEQINNLSLVQGASGIFHLLWQSGLQRNRNVSYACSEDLVHWSHQKDIDLMKGHDAYDVIDPILFYDQTTQNIVVIWASTLPGNYFQAYQEDVENKPRLWYTTTQEFDELSEAKPFFEPGYSVRKGCLFQYNGHYGLIHEDSRMAFQTLRTAWGQTTTGPWSSITNALPIAGCRNPAVIEVGSQYIIYFDQDNDQKRSALVTQDFNTWTDISDFVSFPDGYRYGNVIKINTVVLEGFKALRPQSDVKRRDFS